MQENKIIVGYKIVKPEYEKACVALVPNTVSFEIYEDGMSFSAGSIYELKTQ